MGMVSYTVIDVNDPDMEREKEQEVVDIKES